MDEVAIFWDYENVRSVAQGVNLPIAKALITYSESLGHPRVKKVYSDWAGINKEIIQALYSLGFVIIQVSFGKPNSVDVKIFVYCLETAQLYPEINCFICYLVQTQQIAFILFSFKIFEQELRLYFSQIVADLKKELEENWTPDKLLTNNEIEKIKKEFKIILRNSFQVEN